MNHPIEQYGAQRGIRRQTVERWLRLSESDGEVLLELARVLNIGENHLREILDWTEEMAHRDGGGLREIVMSSSIEPVWKDAKLGRNDKLRRIKEELRRLRFPRLVHAEREIQKRIRTMGLKSEIQLSVPAALEGGSVMLQVKATSHQDLKRLVGELGALVDRPEIKEVFDYLSGEAM